MPDFKRRVDGLVFYSGTCHFQTHSYTCIVMSMKDISYNESINNIIIFNSYMNNWSPTFYDKRTEEFDGFIAL